MTASSQAAPASSPAPNAERPNDGLSLSVPTTLVDAIADAVVARLPDRHEAEPSSPAPVALAVPVADAADRLAMSADHFRRHVLPELKIVRSGRLRLVPVTELEAWIERNSARALETVA